MGDMNLNLLDRDERTMEYIEPFNQFNFQPVITKPTRVANNSAKIIDHLWMNVSDTRSICNARSKIILSDISDHFPCYALLNTQKLKH